VKKEEFRRALMYGFGSAIIFLKDCNNCEEYLDIIFDFSIHNYAFDSQCEGSRVRYLWDLILASSNIEKLQGQIMNKLEDNDSSIYHYQIYQLGVLFAQESEYNPIELMKRHFRYDKNYGSFVGETEIIELDGDKGILFVAHKIAKRLQKDINYDGDYFFVNDLIDSFDKKYIDSLLHELLDTNKRFRQYYLSSLNPNNRVEKREKEDYSSLKLDLKEYQYNRIRPWSRFATEEELKQVYYDINNSCDLELISKLMHAFYKKEYKGRIDRIVNFLDDTRYELSESAVNVLKWKSDNRIRQKAIKLIATKNNWYEYVPLLFENYEKGDYRLILDKCNKEYDEFEWHEIQLTLNNFFSFHRNIDCQELYIKLYNNNRCTICRGEMFKYMLRDGFSDIHILNEAEWDVNLDIRRLVRGS
jgi:hypothetical protein